MKKILLLLLSTAVFGQEVITITASKLEQELTEEATNPKIVQISTTESVSQAIENQTPFRVSGGVVSATGWGESGFKSVLILIDGVRQSREDMAGFRLDTISPNLVERIEVLYGDYSYLYGSGATGGVINIILKKNKDQTTSETIARVSVGYPTFDNILLYHARTGPASVLVEHNFDASTQANNFFQYGTIDMRIDMADNNFMNMFTKVSRVYSPGGLTQAQYEADPLQSVNEDDKFDTVDMGFVTRFGSPELAALLSYKYLGNYYDTTSWASFTSTHSHQVEGNPVAQWESYPTPFLINQLLFGMDNFYNYFMFERFSDSSRDVSQTKVHIHRLKNALWVKNDLISGPFVFSMGGRLGNFLTASNSDTSPNTAGLADFIDWAANVALRYDDGLIFAGASASRGFRHPFIEEQISYYGFGDDFDITIQPETYYSAQSFQGINLDFATLTFNESITYSENEIVFNNVTFQNENQGEALRMVFDANLDITPIDWLVISGYGAYTIAKDLATDKLIPLVPQISAGGRFALDFDWLELAGTADYLGEYYKGGDTTNSSDMIGSRIDVSLSVGVDIGENFTIQAGVTNLLNDYTPKIVYQGFTDDAYYPEEGMEAMVTIELHY